MVQQGEKLHIITRRNFESDLRRHFAGEVIEVTDGVARLRGYTFVFDTLTNQFVKRPKPRTRLFALGDSSHIVNVLPGEVSLDALAYVTDKTRDLVVTDNKDFSLEIHEFGAHR